MTVNTAADPPTTTLEFFNDKGQPHAGTKILYTGPGALRSLWDSPAAAFGKPPRSFDGELRPLTAVDVWRALPTTTGYTIPLTELQWPKDGWKDRQTEAKTLAAISSLPTDPSWGRFRIANQLAL